VPAPVVESVPELSADDDHGSEANAAANPLSYNVPEEPDYPPMATFAPPPPMSVTSSLHGNRHGHDRRSRQGPYDHSHPRKFWRQQLHPMADPLFAARRLHVT
jgi:hypothetical protein